MHSNWSPVASGNTTSDDRNTVENVFVLEPEAGCWRIDVVATEVAEDTHTEDQAVNADFGLVVTGISTTCNDSVGPRRLPRATRTAARPRPAHDCDRDGAVTVRDAACFQRLFALGDRRADVNRDGRLDAADFTEWLAGAFGSR